MLVAYSYTGSLEDAAAWIISALLHCTSRLQEPRQAQNTHGVLLVTQEPEDKPLSLITALPLNEKDSQAKPSGSLEPSSTPAQPNQHACINTCSDAVINTLLIVCKGKATANSTCDRFPESQTGLLYWQHVTFQHVM
jgi:hypothetical protein